MTMAMSNRRRPLTLATSGVIVLLGALAILSPLHVAVAQSGERQAAGGAPLRTITVSGLGTVSATPDAAVFVAGVEVVSPQLATAQEEATRRMMAVLAALREAGVPDEAVQTVDFRVEVVNDSDAPPPPQPAAPVAEVALVAEVAPQQPGTAPAATPQPPAIQGFRVVNEVRVEVADIDQLGRLIDAVLAAGANTVSSIALTVANPTAAQHEARGGAVADARAKAEDLAQAAGARLGSVLTIEEAGGAPPPQPLAAPAPMAESTTPISPGQTEISVGVRVTYELTPGDEAMPAAVPGATPAP
jgi:uncharacterized protein YggE